MEICWFEGEKRGGREVMPKGERGKKREKKASDAEGRLVRRRDWSLLIFTISAPDNLWPKWRFDANRPRRLTCSEAAEFSSRRAAPRRRRDGAGQETSRHQNSLRNCDMASVHCEENIGRGGGGGGGRAGRGGRRWRRRRGEKRREAKQWYSALLAVEADLSGSRWKEEGQSRRRVKWGWESGGVTPWGRGGADVRGEFRENKKSILLTIICWED